MIKVLFTQYKHLIREGSWVFFGQISVAIISLVGLRILTEIAPANILGGATLLLGALALIRNIFIAPIGNTQIRFHPEYTNAGHAKWFDDNIKKLYKRLIVISILVFIVIFFIWSYLSSYAFNLLLLLILIFYYTLDAVKSFKINRLSAERRQKYAAIWQIADALLVNVFFIVALLIVNNVESYLAGQAFGLFIGLLLFGFISFPKIENMKPQNPDYAEIKSKVMQYGLPFIPLAIVSWISNLGDRYIIEKFLSLNEVGIYTAVYSISSRPILMVSGILSGLFRPILFQKESSHKILDAEKTFRIWLLLAGSVAIIILIIYYFFGSVFISLLLSEAYSQNVFNIFFIVGISYAIFFILQIFENRIYAFGFSKKLIIPNATAAMINIVANIILIPKLGIDGAAAATLISFFIQLIFLIIIYLNYKNAN